MDVLVVVISGAADDWLSLNAHEKSPALISELNAAPAITIAVVADGIDPGANAVLAAHDIAVLEGNQGSSLVSDHQPSLGPDALVEAIGIAPRPALIAAQALRVSDGTLTTESVFYSLLQSGPDFRHWAASQDSARQQSILQPDGISKSGDSGVIFDGRRIVVINQVEAVELLLNRPEKHNALDSVMRDELCNVLDVLALRGRTFMALGGVGPSFCSGGDLNEFGKLTNPIDAHVVRTNRSIARRLNRFRDTLVAGLHGRCIGAGIELPAFSGYVIAASDTKIQLPELRFGLIPGAGGTVSLPRRIGTSRTFELILSGRTLDAKEARILGLVDEVVSQDSLRERTVAVASSRKFSDRQQWKDHL